MNNIFGIKTSVFIIKINYYLFIQIHYRLKKRKLSPEDEKFELTQPKTGRKNIREVLDDSRLQARTQKADKEEEKRRERISTRHKLVR